MNVHVIGELLTVVDRWFGLDSECLLDCDVFARVTVYHDYPGGVSVDQAAADPILIWIVDCGGSNPVFATVKVDYV